MNDNTARKWWLDELHREPEQFEPWPAPGVYSPEQAHALSSREHRINEITRALQFDPHTPYRRELMREFLDLTEASNVG